LSVAYAACLWRLRTLSFLPPTRLIYSPQPSAARTLSCLADSSNCAEPYMRFMSFGPEVCLGLPSDSTSRWTPLPSATATAAFTAQDLHLVDNAHAGHTKRSTRTGKTSVRSPAYLLATLVRDDNANARRLLMSSRRPKGGGILIGGSLRFRGGPT